MANPETEAMQAALRSNAPQGLADLYREHFAYVYRVLLRLGVPRPNAEDAAQDVFLVVNRRLADFDSSAPMRPWLFGIARRVAADRRKRSQRAERRLEMLPTAQPPPGPDEQVSAREASQMLETFLDELVESDREVFVLCELEAVSGTDAAAVLGVNRNTLYSRLRKLRERFEAEAKRRFGGKS